jgi:hypothetical protein
MGLRDNIDAAPRPQQALRPEDHDTDHLLNRFWGHFIIGFTLFDAYMFRQRLVPELVSTLPALAQQGIKLLAAAAAAAVIVVVLYLFTRRTSRTRTRLYIFGAFLFAAFTVAMIVDDYHRYAEPGTFTQRMNTAYQKILTYADALRGR